MRFRELLNEETELERVIKLSKANEWIKHGPFKLYIRVGERVVDEKRVKAIDLANFEITDEKERGKGHFSTLLKLVNDLGKKYSYDGIYVESILNPGPAELQEHTGTYLHPLPGGPVDPLRRIIDPRNRCQSLHRGHGTGSNWNPSSELGPVL